MENSTNLFIIFLTGLTTGGLTCLAVQGGLLASVIASPEAKLEKKIENNGQALPILSFLGAKIVAHALLGILLGFLGSALTLTPSTRGILQILIAVYLFGIAMNLLDVHPFFRYFIITPPKFLSRLVKNQSRSNSLFAPAILGAMTIFIPCATTQAMEVVALGVANPLYSSAILTAFILGTTPTFFALSFVYAKLSSKFQNVFSKVSAALLITMAIITFNGGLGLMGSIYTLQNFYEAAKVSLTSSGGTVAGATANQTNGQQNVTIDVYSSGYTPNNITIKKGIKTVITLRTNNTGGCARSFTIPSLGLQKLLPTTGVETLEFTPTKPGPLVFSCSMGMYTGTFNVI